MAVAAGLGQNVESRASGARGPELAPQGDLFRGRLAGALERHPLSRAYGHSDTERERDRVRAPPGPDVGHAGETHKRAPRGQSRLSTPDTRRRLIRAPIQMAGGRDAPRGRTVSAPHPGEGRFPVLPGPGCLLECDVSHLLRLVRAGVFITSPLNCTPQRPRGTSVNF